MKARACIRTWEAEAIGDGRLDLMARASFERHAIHCAECGKELQTLARIDNALRELPEYGSQAIDRRRGRIVLLERANASQMRGRRRMWGAWAFASLAVSALAFTTLAPRWRVAVSALVPTGVAPSFEVVDVAHARWTTTGEAGTARVALADGTAAIHVQHLAERQRFLVDLPDGDLEVRGTRFQVSVADRGTKRVDVTEGVVALRLRGEPEIVLFAGQQWSSTERVAPLAIVPSAPASVVPSPQAVVPPSLLPIAPAPVAFAPAAAPSPTPRDAAALVVDRVQVGDGFPECIRAFEASDYSGADHLLAAFMRDNPSDPRSEDAAFLRALSHARMGDASGSARLARDYLHRYPQALRRKEAQRLVGSGDP